MSFATAGAMAIAAFALRKRARVRRASDVIHRAGHLVPHGPDDLHRLDGQRRMQWPAEVRRRGDQLAEARPRPSRSSSGSPNCSACGW